MLHVTRTLSNPAFPVLVHVSSTLKTRYTTHEENAHADLMAEPLCMSGLTLGNLEAEVMRNRSEIPDRYS